MPLKTVFETDIDGGPWTAAEYANLGDRVGDIRWEYDANGNLCCYKFVEFHNTSATVAATVNAPVAYDTTLTGARNRVVSDWSDADTIPVGAGLTMVACAGVLATSYYLWIQIKGVSAASIVPALAGSVAIGEKLTTHATTDMTLTQLADLEDGVYGLCIGTDIMRCDFPF
jgi:hypothetical protein